MFVQIVKFKLKPDTSRESFLELTEQMFAWLKNKDGLTVKMPSIIRGVVSTKKELLFLGVSAVHHRDRVSLPSRQTGHSS